MNKLRFGVLGTGNIVGKAGPALQQAFNGEWIGVAGRTAENSRAAADKYGVPKAYAGYSELLDDPEIDAVYIALLNHLHKEWAIRAIQAGKHVLVEKPFALNAEDAEDIIRQAKQHGVRAEEAFVSRTMEGHTYAREAIAAGQIGDPVHFIGNFSFQAAETSTRLNPAWGGGALYDVGCYLVAWSRFQFGEEPLSADCRMIRAGEAGVDLRFAGTLQFPGGGTALMTAAIDMPYGCGYQVRGTKGELEVKQFGNAQSITLQVTINGETRDFVTDRITPFRLQAERFAAHVLAGETMPDGGASIMAQARVMDALFESDKRNARITLERQTSGQ
ncbi:Gfo/Idh/MocA family protein [Paenibacillus ginsengarvi]|uniref:Gfo/Idh/MocA family oxidoreductase n=1 Tax=Paenibacillus ginsengarvi TaxID=400777 RepID=A0A3B0C824_9BACL|nr:Gfo/Idh/MocA family oxidoreductase [Paenibacillus ginsengarvi]RKN79076.1 gfo/Idh/MocA family oxidoreductase [Paenibacillus ginsengarvi]